MNKEYMKNIVAKQLQNEGAKLFSDRLELESKLEALLLEDTNFNELEREFDQYCPFEALGMVRSEIRHGNYLAYLLNPGRPHGFNTQVLRAFLMCVAQKCYRLQNKFQLKAIDVHLIDLDQAEVRREWRNIDILIVLQSSKIVIPIELKIDSSQSDDQLRRYRKIVEHEWPSSQGWRHINIFLTKLKEVPIDVDHWEPLRIHDLVEYLQILADQFNTSHAVEMLRSYLRMLRRHHLENQRLEEIARKLWAQHSEALGFLADRRPDETGNLFEALKDRKTDFIEILKQNNVDVTLDADQNSIIRFAFKKWDTLPGFKMSNWTETQRFILLEIKREGLKISAYLYLGPGDEPAREKYVALLSNHRLRTQKSRIGKGWMSLAKQEIFSPQPDNEIDPETTSKVIIKLASSFALEVFEHFDPLLKKLETASLTLASAD